MIVHRDLQLASVLVNYLKSGGNKKHLFTDCLTVSHILRRIDDAIGTKTIVLKLSKFLNESFVLYMKPTEILSPYEMRLYLRVFIASRLVPVITIWNQMHENTQITKEPFYDVINADNMTENVVYMYFSNEMGESEKTYVALPSDILKSILVRTTIEIKTFANSNAQHIHRIVYSEENSPPITEENTYPIKVYSDTDINDLHLPFLNGKYIVSDV